MKFKVGDEWFECLPGQPIMVELTDTDKRNLANMPPEATKYAVFDDQEQEQMTRSEMFAWMEAEETFVARE